MTKMTLTITCSIIPWKLWQWVSHLRLTAPYPPPVFFFFLVIWLFFFHIRLSDSRLLKCSSLRGNSLESWASTVRLPPYFLRWSCRLEILYNVYLYSKMGAGQHADSMQVSNRRLPCAGWWGHSMLACFRNPVVIFHANFFFFSTQSTASLEPLGDVRNHHQSYLPTRLLHTGESENCPCCCSWCYSLSQRGWLVT